MQSDDLGLVERLNDEAERLSGHSIDRGNVDAGIASNLASEAAAAIERRVAERDEAREALKPFAALYTESMRDYPDGTAKQGRPDDRQAWGFNNANLMWGDFRRARQALKDAP